MIMLDSLTAWSRAQFALTAFYHWLFVPLTLGLSFIVAFMHTFYVRTGDEKWKETAKFWMKLFAVNFAIGVASGIILEFQFGTNWSNYSWFVGDIFGAPLAIEGIFAFFLESTFVAVMLFGWDRVNKKFHLLSTWLTAFGTNLSAVWILVANAWMQEPAGTQFNPLTGRNEMVSFWSVALSETAVHKFLHTIMQSYLLAAIFVVGVSAWYLLKNRHINFAKTSILIASIFGSLAALMVAITGDGSAYTVAKKQPMKLAVMEGLYEGRKNAGLFIIGIPQEGKDAVGIRIPGLLSLLATRSFDGFVPGVKDLMEGNEQYGIPSMDERIQKGKLAINAYKEFNEALKKGDTASAKKHEAILKSNFEHFGYGFMENKEQAKPKILNLTFYAFHLMVGFGIYFILYLLWVIYLAYKDKLANNKLALRLGIINIPLVYITSQLGWIVAEVGRQPWTIQDLLPTWTAVSAINPAHVKTTFFIFVVIFTTLLIAELGIMFKMIGKGPNLKEE